MERAHRITLVIYISLICKGKLIMNSDSCLCQICYLQYNDRMQLPKMLDCGHTLCSKCLYTIPQVNNCIQCPVCRKMMTPYAFLATNYTALKLVEDMSKNQATMCRHYPGHKADFMCLFDKEKICLYCKAFGDHKEHDLLPLEEFQSSLKEKDGDMEVIELNDLSVDFNAGMRERLIKSIENTYDQMMHLISEIKVNTTQKICKEFERALEKMQSPQDDKKQLEIFSTLERLIAENNHSNETFALELLGRELDPLPRNDYLDLKKVQQKTNIFCDQILKALDGQTKEIVEISNNSFNEEFQDLGCNGQSKNVDKNSNICIFVKTSDGPLGMEVKYSDCLADIRQRLVKEGKCSPKTIFYYENRPLNMNCSFYHYNIQNNSQLILRYC